MDIIGGFGSDPDLFEAFYREHLEEVQRFVARRVDDPHVAADLTADIFVAVIEGADRYNPGVGPLRAWLFGIARHVVLIEYRRRTRFDRAIGRLGGHRVLEPDAMAHALDRIDAEASVRALLTDIAAMSPVLRDVLELVAVDELSVTEAAAVLGISANTARVRLHRARRQLGRTLPAAHPLEVPR